MYDQNWRDIAQDTTTTGAPIKHEAPADGYDPGIYLDCALFGKGVIEEVTMRGSTKQLHIKFAVLISPQKTMH